jgi:dipeptide/tripeptide permease
MGLLFAIWSGLSFLTSLLSGRVRLRAAARLALGLLLSAAGFTGLLGAAAQLSLPLVMTGLAVSGVGAGLMNAALTQLAIESVPHERAAMGSGANNTARYVGSCLGTAATGALVGVLGPVSGTSVALLTAMALSLATAAAVLVARR